MSTGLGRNPEHPAARILVRRIIEAGAAAAQPRHARVERASVNREPRDRVCVPRRTAILPATRLEPMDTAARVWSVLPCRRVEIALERSERAHHHGRRAGPTVVHETR